MKAKIFGSWGLVLVLVSLTLIAATLQRPQADVTGGQTASNDMASVVQADAQTNISTAEQPAPVENSEPAPAAISNPVPLEVKLSRPAGEIVRLAQSGVSEEVMLAYINNVNSRFNLGSDQIVYLNDLGISGAVVKAMIERDGAIDAASQIALTAVNPPPTTVVTNPPLPPEDTNAAPPPPPDDSTTMNPPDNPGDSQTVEDTTYFNDSLAPYGTWIYVNGYGRCWQPTVCVVNHDWQPYCDRGRWVNTDCGWYWQSDYSWGWAPFHYGRWFCDDHRGWVWAPNRVWGPAWVSWRQSRDFCGWAPLPPSARFVPGIGFRFGNHSVGANFEFGLRAKHYTFIPVGRLSDYSPGRYAATHEHADRLFGQTAVINNFTFERNRVVQHGVDPKKVATLARTDIRQVEIRDMPHNGSGGFQTDRLTRRYDKLVIFRPQLPQPTVSHVSSHNVAGTGPGNPGQILLPPGRISGAPKTSPNDAIVNSAGPQPVLGAQTASQHKPMTEVENKPAAPLVPRHDVPQPVNATPQLVNTSPYPAHSLILTGPKNVGSPQAVAPTPLPNMNFSHQPPMAQQPDYPANYRGQSAAPPTAVPQWGNQTALPPQIPQVRRQESTASYTTYNNNGFGGSSQTRRSTMPTAQVQPQTQMATPLNQTINRFQGSNPQYNNNYTPTPAYHPQSAPLLLPPSYSPPAPAPVHVQSYQVPQQFHPEPVAAPTYHAQSAPILVPTVVQSAPAPAPASAPAPAAASHSSSTSSSSSSRNR